MKPIFGKKLSGQSFENGVFNELTMIKTYQVFLLMY
jgi:hypothetical protein